MVIRPPGSGSVIARTATASPQPGAALRTTPAASSRSRAPRIWPKPP